MWVVFLKFVTRYKWHILVGLGILAIGLMLGIKIGGAIAAGTAAGLAASALKKHTESENAVERARDEGEARENKINKEHEERVAANARSAAARSEDLAKHPDELERDLQDLIDRPIDDFGDKPSG